MRLASRLALCSMVCWSILALAPHGLGQRYQGKQLVKAELLADTSTIVPGKPFTVGLLLRMAPGWHIGDIQWPIPLKTIDPGDIQTYGYMDEVLLMQEVTPPPKIENSPIELGADASWLVCEKICIPGS